MGKENVRGTLLVWIYSELLLQRDPLLFKQFLNKNKNLRFFIKSASQSVEIWIEAWCSHTISLKTQSESGRP